MRLYPYGGHLGNIWFPENKEYVLEPIQNGPLKLEKGLKAPEGQLELTRV